MIPLAPLRSYDQSREGNRWRLSPRALFTVIALAIWPPVVHAEALRVVCAEIPPLCYREGHENSGFAFEIGEEILRRVDNHATVEIQPFARALYSVQSGHHTIALWLGRTPEREKTVIWIAPVLIDAFHVFTLKGHAEAQTLEQARQLRSLAAIISGANVLTAQHLELGRIELTSSEEANGNKLLSGRVEGWIATRAAVGSFLRRNPEAASRIVQGVKLVDYSAYLVASPDVDEKTIVAWRQAFQAIERDGFLQKVLEKYGVPLPQTR